MVGLAVWHYAGALWPPTGAGAGWAGGDRVGSHHAGGLPGCGGQGLRNCCGLGLHAIRGCLGPRHLPGVLWHTAGSGLCGTAQVWLLLPLLLLSSAGPRCKLRSSRMLGCCEAYKLHCIMCGPGGGCFRCAAAAAGGGVPGPQAAVPQAGRPAARPGRSADAPGATLLQRLVSGRGEEGQEFRAGAVKGVKKGDFLPHVAACGSRTALSRVCWYSIDCTLFSTYSRRALTTHVRGCLRPLPACTMPVHSRGLHSAMLPQVALGLVPVCACSTRCRAGRLHVRLLVSVTACWLPLPPPPLCCDAGSTGCAQGMARRGHGRPWSAPWETSASSWLLPG